MRANLIKGVLIAIVLFILAMMSIKEDATEKNEVIREEIKGAASEFQ